MLLLYVYSKVIINHFVTYKLFENMSGKEVKRRRGPSNLKGFWKDYDPGHKIPLEFNREGQPCGITTCKLTSPMGNLVKGKEISLAASNLNKVPKYEKDKLWNTVKVHN